MVDASFSTSYAEPIPLSFAQKRLWFTYQLEGRSAAYNMPFALRFEGELNRAALKQALADVVERHETLRTVVKDTGETAEQFVIDTVCVELPLIELTTDEASLPDALKDAAGYNFDLEREIPMRAWLFALSENSHVLLVVLHHIACDGWSLAPLTMDLSTAYTARCAGTAPAWEPLPVQYADYTLWQRELLGEESDPDSLIARQSSYWKHTLAELPEQLNIATDRPYPQIASHRGDAVYFTLETELHQRVHALAREHQATPFMVLHAALVVLLSKLGAGDDIVLGSPIAGRTDEGLHDLVGFFVNNLVLRVDMSGNPSFEQLLARVRSADLAAYEHQDMPFERLVEILNPTRSLSHQPLFQATVVLQNNADASLELPGLRVSAEPLHELSAKNDLYFTFIEQDASADEPGAFLASIDYATDLFDQATAERIAQRLMRVLHQVVAAPTRPLSEIDVLDAEEREQLLFHWNDSARALPATTLPDLFEQRVQATPDAPAVIFGDTVLSYAELDSKANQLARHLLDMGVGPESLVALCVERSPLFSIGLLGILKAGAAYLPIDPNYPAERVAWMLNDAMTPVLITEAAVIERLPAHWAQLVELDTDGALIATQPASAPARESLPDSLAYMIYTSGSTGTPKGVALSHRGVASLIASQIEHFTVTPASRVLQFASASFDAAFWECCMGLLSGAQLVFAPSDELIPGDALVQLLRRHAITHVTLPPAALPVMSADNLPDCAQLIVAGDACPPAQVARWSEGRRMFNAYGPTETTVCATIGAPLRGAVAPTIGRPIANAQVYILDAAMQPVPVGVAGDLYLAGQGLARGYFQRPALTAERFVANPFTPGQRMYRSGDLARWLPDGELDFLGRVDHQVKVRGFRIELGEIEAALARLPNVAQSVVLAREDLTGQKQLVGYVVANEGTTLDPAALRQALAGPLPDYMVPAAIVLLDALPLTPNGKLDRKALPAPDYASAERRAPRTPQETALAGLFAEVLGLERVGIDDSFFDLGGHSLLATRLVSRIRATLDVELAIRTLFEHPCVAALAQQLDGAESGRAPLRAMPRPERLPLSFAQQRLWFIQQLEGPSGTYNIPLALRLQGRLNREALIQALHDLSTRHESLRTVFVEVEGVACQHIIAAEHAWPALTELTLELPALEQAVAEAATRGFDLATQSPLRVHLFRLGEQEYVLLLVLHHIAGDGWSLTPLLRDLSQAYAARLERQAPTWSPLPVQYADYSLWQRELLGEESNPDSLIALQGAYWKRTLAELPEQLAIPTDRPRPAVASYRGKAIQFQLGADLHRRLLHLAREQHATLFMVLHAAFAVLLGKLGAGEDIAIGSPIAGRTDDALNELIGFFINTLVLRTDLSGNPSFRELLERVRVADLAAYAHQDLPFERLVEMLNPNRSLAHQPLFQVMLDLQSGQASEFALPGLSLRDEPLGVASVKCDLNLVFVECHTPDGAADGLFASIDYTTDLFDEASVRQLAQRLSRVLERVAQAPDTSIAGIGLLDDAERQQLLHDANATTKPVLQHTAIARFEQQVRRTPDAIALVSGDNELSYAELNRRANYLAHRLIGKGIGPEQLVAIALPRSPDALVAILAVLKSGGAYLPLDLNYPADRLRLMLEDARPSLVIGGEAARAWLATGYPLLAPDCDEDGAAWADPDDTSRLLPLTLQHPAYVIYTSGSTGLPKGVVVSHGNLNDFVTWAVAYFGERLARVWLSTSLCFDVSVFELFAPLCSGGRVQLVQDLLDLAEQPREWFEGSLISTVPSALSGVLEQGLSLQGVHSMVLAGEALPAALLERLAHEWPQCQVANLYGPTEATVYVTGWDGEDASASGIGGPLTNTRVYVLDAGLQPVPVGVPGELYLAGDGLARGYLKRPALTAERFVANPFTSGERMYRTGDLVRWRAGGELDFLGRVDHQVKVRGFRIELGEIEAALTRQPGVAHGVVVAREDQPGHKQLVGYAVAAEGVVLDPAMLRQALAGPLPDYMVPAAIVLLDALPLTPNGKLDRKALPAPDYTRAESRQPRTPQEIILATLFAEVLGLDKVGIDDSFFDLGGHSLLATRLVSRIRATLDVELAIRTLFEYSSVATLAQQLANAERGRAPLRSMPRPEYLPLSFAQQRLWFIQQMEGASGTYNIPLALRLHGALNRQALTQALHDVIARHESLRTVFTETQGVAYQHILAAEQARPHLIEHRIDEAGFAQALADASMQGFELATQSPLRTHVFELGEHQHVLLLVLHHIAGDGWSLAPLLRDLSAAYAARVEQQAPTWSPLPVQYADYSLWQRELLGEESDPDSAIEKQCAYWRRQLAALPEQLNLPSDRPRPAVASYRGDVVRFQLDAELHRGLLHLAREQHATLFMVLHAAFALLLSKLGAGEDIAIGSPIAGRTDDALNDLIGFFLNTLVLRTDLSGNPSFRELLERVRATDLAAYAHQDLPFERLVEMLNPVRSLAHQPLFQVMLMLQNNQEADLALPGLAVQPEEIGKSIAKFDLRLAMGEQWDADGLPAGIAAELEYACDLFDADSMQTLVARLTDLLRAVVANPAVSPAQISLLISTERSLLEQWNDTTQGRAAATLPELFERQAQATPDTIALVFGQHMLSYAELNRRANQLAHRLIDCGVGSEQLIALAMPRSIELVIALLAILKSGAAYLPVDPAYPPERIAAMLNDARPAGILSTVEAAASLPAGARLILVDDTASVNAAFPPAHNPTDSERLRPLRPEHAAYVIYTSGSTGQPKGVCIPHRNAAGYLRFLASNYAVGAQDVVLNLTSISFDPSIRDMLCPLLAGARLVMIDDASARDPAACLQALHRHAVTSVLSMTPSLLHELVAAQQAAPCELQLRQLLTCGEALRGELLLRAMDALGCTVLANQYGPTECTMTSTWKAFRRGDYVDGPVPVGRLVDNAQAYVLDAGLQQVPVGVPGELYLAGDGLARGYLKRPALTAERFVANPFTPGERMYRTGDLVRWLAGGELDFLGRVDHQVKVRGFRIELGEIEAALTRQPGVAHGVVVAREDQPGHKQLVGYAVAAEGVALDPAALRQALAGPLPDYMVPAAIVLLDALPLTPNGKLDRKALPAPDYTRAESRQPRTPQEIILATLFAEVLGLDNVGIDDSFFDLGGHSLLATRLVSRIRATLDVELAIRTLFEHPSVVALAQQLDSAERGRAPLRAMPRPERLPLSFAQQRLWFIQQLEGPGGTYNMPLALRLHGTLNRQALTQALHDVIARHESLRTVFAETQGVAYQHILAVEQARPHLIEHRIDEAGFAQALADASMQGFELATQSPLRTHVFELGEHQHVLLLVLHHIAGDGWSLAPLLRDLSAAYAARVEQQAPTWSPLPVQYADYSLWQRELLGEEADPDSAIEKQCAYWRRQLAALPEQLNLPSDRPRPAVASYRGDVVRFQLDAELHRGLLHLAREQHATLFMVLHAAFALLLSKLGAGEDITIGSPIAGRTDDALHDLIGFFVNTLVLRTDLSGNPSFRELLERVRATDLAAYAHQDLPFERLVEMLNPVRSLAHQPLFQVMLLLQNNHVDEPVFAGLQTQPQALDKSIAKFDLRLSLGETRMSDGAAGGIVGELEYSCDLFERATAERFASRLERLLTAIVAAPARSIDALSLLDDAEREQVVVNWNATTRALPALSFPVLFEQQVSRAPDAIAAVFEQERLTYAELNARANRLARALVAQGIGPEQAVAVALPRSLDMLVALLAVLKSGAAYLPLDL
ncbi:non-ribosomal peptide synthetase, partial [Dyella tabacisoli]